MDYVWIHINVISIKEKLAIIINQASEKGKYIAKGSMNYRARKQKQQFQKKKKNGEDDLRLHLYYKLILLSLKSLGGGCRGGCWSFAFKVFLGGYGESYQHDLHVLGSLFLLGRFFRGV